MLFTAEEPWSNDAKLYQPYEAEQILLAENASCLAVKAYLNVSWKSFWKKILFFFIHWNRFFLSFYQSDVWIAIYSGSMCECRIYVTGWSYDEIASFTVRSICCVRTGTNYKFGGEKRRFIDVSHGCRRKTRPSSLFEFDWKDFHKCRG